MTKVCPGSPLHPDNGTEFCFVLLEYQKQSVLWLSKQTNRSICSNNKYKPCYDSDSDTVSQVDDNSYCYYLSHRRKVPLLHTHNTLMFHDSLQYYCKELPNSIHAKQILECCLRSLLPKYSTLRSPSHGYVSRS